MHNSIIRCFLSNCQALGAIELSIIIAGSWGGPRDFLRGSNNIVL
jgi:hypothetical protein